jgi:hypothetical protein
MRVKGRVKGFKKRKRVPVKLKDGGNKMDIRTFNTIVRCILYGGYESADIEKHHLRILIRAKFD